MGQERAVLVFTDPPYGVSYVAATSKKDHALIINDELRSDFLLGFLANSFRTAYQFATDQAAI